MSSDEDFDAAPDVRQSTEYARVCPYMFEPLAAKPISPEVGLESRQRIKQPRVSRRCERSADR